MALPPNDRRTSSKREPGLWRILSASWLLIIALAIYSLTWCAQNLPTYFGLRGQLFLFPFFLLCWLVTSALALAAVSAAIVGLVRRDRALIGSTRAAGWTIALSAIFLLASLPLLWFGGAPWT